MATISVGAKIQEALKAVAELPSISDDPDAPTFGKLIEQGRLPGGEPEEN